MMIAKGIAYFSDTVEHTAGVFGGCGQPHPHADQHVEAWSAVRHVSVAYQPLRLEERACFSSLSPSAATDSHFQWALCVPHRLSDTR